MATVVPLRARDSIASRVARLRAWAGASAREVSALAGLSASHISLIERGTRTEVSAATLGNIATLFGTTIEWLLSGVGDAPTQASVQQAVDVARRRAS